MDQSHSQNFNRDMAEIETDSSPDFGLWIRFALGAILLVYLVLSMRFLSVLPLWGSVHDEPLHFGYCKYLAVRGHLPRIGEDIFMDPRLYYTTPSAGEAAHHPPGFYFLGSLVYRLFSRSSLAAQNYALRCLSLLLGLVSLLFLYNLCREVFHDNPALSLVTLAGVAVFPHWLMMSSVIYVETFGAMATTGALWMLVRYARQPKRWPSLCLAGFFVALMSLTKMTLLAFCLAATWIALARVLESDLARRTKLWHSAGFLAVGAAVAGWWYVRNLVVYGQLFPTSVLPGQLDTAIKVGGHPADLLTLFFIPLGRLYYWLALSGAFHSFWCPTDWLPPATRPVMYSLAALTWLVTPVGVWRGLAKQEAELVWLWRRFVVPFLFGFLVFFFFYVRWTVTTCIQAHGEFGKFVMPLFGFLAILFVIALRELVGVRRAVAIGLGFAVFSFLWDLLAVHHLVTALIPLHGSPGLP